MDSQTVRNEMFLSDKTKIEQFVLGLRRHVWFAPDMMVDDSFLFWKISPMNVLHWSIKSIEIHIIH